MKHLSPLMLFVSVALFTMYSCTSSEVVQQTGTYNLTPITELQSPSPDPRVGLGAGLFDAEETIWNLSMLSTTPSPENFFGETNSDLAFQDNYVIQGNYNGFVIWDITDPSNPVVAIDYLCPASQSDVSIYKNLLFVSGEGLGGRLDCGTDGVRTAVSQERLRGIRIFDITDIYNPEYIANVQTCRGSHTHSVLVDPDDTENVYVYVSGSAPVRPDAELPGCSAALPDEDPNSALFRIEVIKVPLANPELAAIANSPRIFEGLEAPPRHGLAPEEQAAIDRARAAGAFVAEFRGQERVINNRMVAGLLAQIVEARGGTGEPTAADSAALRQNLQAMISEMEANNPQIRRGPNQCHDITLFPEAGLAGGACEGYGLLLDISDPTAPVRMDAVADSNFAYWHSATFNNDGTTVIFTDEWGGGSQPKCRETDPYEWGANAIFSIENGKMEFQSYFKMPAPQTSQENCVAHNGSLIPIPGRDIMVQGWYQGGINVFDFTDPANPIEIAFHDRGPLDANRMQSAGSWSVYWYNGVLVNSEIARGLDIFELTPSEYLTENEIAASKTVTLEYFNPQGQPKFTWPASYALARAYADQLERNRELDLTTLQMVRSSLSQAERARGTQQSRLLNELASNLEGSAIASSNIDKVNKLADTVKQLASGM
jgi:hypothetical protein